MSKGILALFGGGDAGEEGGEESKDMACKAMFKAIKRDDYESFASALDDFLTYREDGASKDDEGEEDEAGGYAGKPKSKLFE